MHPGELASFAAERLSAGDPQSAIDALLCALSLEPSEPRLYFNIGLAFRQNEQIEEAVASFRRALALGLEDADVHHALALSLGQDARYESALSAVAAGRKLAPDDAGLFVTEGNLYSSLGEEDKAAVAFEAALTRHPDDARALYNLGALVFREADPTRALHLLERARTRARDPAWAEALIAFYQPEGPQAASSPLPEFLESSLRLARDLFEPGVRRFGNQFPLLDYAIERSPRTGYLVELGVRRGTTFAFLAKRWPGRSAGFDSFVGLPESWDGQPVGLYTTGGALPRGVGEGDLARAELHPGLFEDTLPSFCERPIEPLGFVHFDCDIYSSTWTGLTHLAPRLSPGAVLVFDEYFGYPGWQGHEHRALERAREHGLDVTPIAMGLMTRQVAFRVEGPEDVASCRSPEPAL